MAEVRKVLASQACHDRRERSDNTERFAAVVAAKQSGRDRHSRADVDCAGRYVCLAELPRRGRRLASVRGLWLVCISDRVARSPRRSQTKKQPLWWGILLWGVVLMDLQVFAIAGGSSWSRANAVGIAFASSQAGALICFAALGATSGRLRIPAAAIGLAFTFFFAVSLSATDAWYTVLLLQALATAIVCLVLRWLGFRIERVDLLDTEERAENRMQFSIRHLFYWTTGVAIILALGRLIGWRTLLWMGTQTDLHLLTFAPLLTLVSILAMWGALGRERWIARLSVLLVMLQGSVLSWSVRCLGSQARASRVALASLVSGLGHE